MRDMNQPRSPRARRQAGFTILELALTVLIVGVVMVKASEVFSSSSKAQNSMSVRDVLEERVRATTERITNRLRQAGETTVLDVPEFPEASRSIRFRRLTGYDLANGQQWGPEESIALVRPNQEQDLALVVWSSGVQGSVWATDVDDIRFSREGRRIRFAIEASALGPEADRITVRRDSDVTLQN